MRNDIGTLVFIFLVFPVFGWSQDYKFHHITTADGLSHNEVRKIVKDSLGFLWLGTQKGLNRYDGYRLKVFHTVPEDSTSLMGDKIFSLAATGNQLWVGSVTGLSIINTATLEIIQNAALKERIGSEGIMQLFYDPDAQQVWTSTETENFIIDPKTFSMQTILDDYKIVCLAKGNAQDYWIGTDKGLLHYNWKQRSIIKTYDIGSFGSHSLDQIFTNSYGEVWVTLGNTIFRFQSERERFLPMHQFKALNGMAQNREGDIFFGSYGKGVLRYSRDSGIFDTISANPENHLSISSNDVYDVFVDEENIIWIGTQEGLDYFDDSRNRFQSLVHLPNNKNSLRSSFVQTIFQGQDDALWIGTREGIDRITFDEGYTNPIFYHYDLNWPDFESLNSKYISWILQDRRNRLWIATMYDGLYLIDEANRLYKHFTFDPADDSSIASSSVRAIMEDNKGRIWLGTSRGVSLVVEKRESHYSFENLGYTKFDSNTAPQNDVYTVFQDSKGRIWIGTNNGGLGLLTENGDSRELRYFRNNPLDSTSLSNDEVFIAYEDSRQQLWFGTSAGGLNLLQEDGKSKVLNGYYFKRYTEADGLADNEINSILEDGNGNLWIATNTGLSKFQSDEGIFINYAPYDGILKGKFRKNARWKTEDGTLFFGGAAGINYFNPDDFIINDDLPVPLFSELLIDGKVIGVNQPIDGKIILEQALASGTSLNLPAKDNRFELKFSSRSFSSPDRCQYAYKLEGFDQDWNLVSGNDPGARYAKLKPGTYKFYLKASNNDGVWNETPIQLSIKVRPNFMDRNSVRLGIAILYGFIIVVGVFVFRRYTQHIRSRDRSYHRSKKYPRVQDPETDQENIGKVKALNTLMESEKTYLDPGLDLAQMANSIDVSTNHLSVLLNDYIGKNFYDYVNHYRVEEVKRRLKDPNFRKQTLSSIGGDCGFNSKSAFNRIFKNMTGQTPSQYQNS